MHVQVVFQTGKEFCGDGAESARAVPGILQTWIADLQAFQILQAMHSELHTALQQRVSNAPSDTAVWLWAILADDKP